MSQASPSFDLVVATIDRTLELDRLLDSLEAQDYPRLRVIVVDQNRDDRVTEILGRHALEFLHLRSSEPSLSRARNEGLARVSSDLVAFPDDDCVYPPGLLGHVAEVFSGDPTLAGLTGRAEDTEGRSAPSWKRDAALLTIGNLWNRAISYTIFLRRAVVDDVGAFDERLGLGSPEPWSSGEETDYLIRAVRAGARIAYDPALVVLHDVRADDARVGYRDGASVGYLLRKHGYPPKTVARMLVRPVGGVLASIARLDGSRAAYHQASLRGRVRGYRGASRSKTSR